MLSAEPHWANRQASGGTSYGRFLYNMRRDYDPSTGRYLEPDPLGLFVGATDLYEYAENNPTAFVDPLGLFSVADLPLIPRGVASFAAGVGDALSWNATSWIRDQFGSNSVIDKCSPEYSAGEWTGVAISVGEGLAGGLRAAGSAGVGREFSHWLPRRMGGPRSIWNGNFVPPWRHYYHDPFRFPRGWRNLGPKWPAWLQQFDRIPNTFKGTGIGALWGGLGAAVAGEDCKCRAQ